MGGWRKTILWTAGGLAAALALAWLSLVGGLSTGAVNRLVRTRLGKLLAGSVHLGSVRTNLFSTISISDLLVLSDQGGIQLPVLSVGKVVIHYRLWPLILRRDRWTDDVDSIRLQGVKIFLLRDPSGGWNAAALVRPLLESLRRGRAGKAQAGVKAPLIATRVDLRDAVLVLDDQRRGFHSTINALRGTLDTRRLPLLSFDLKGQADQSDRDNLLLKGSFHLGSGISKTTLDLSRVPLARYVNYLLRQGGPQFLRGLADLRLQLEQKDGRSALSGRADLDNGVLKIPGVARPLTGLSGEVDFSGDGLRFSGLSGDFLGSAWTAGGAIRDLKRPSLELYLENPALDLSKAAENFRGLAALGLSGTAAVGVSITGEARQPLVEGAISCGQLRIYGSPLRDFGANLKWRGRRLELYNLKATAWEGTMRGGGSLVLPARKGAAGTVEAQLKIRSFSLEDFFRRSGRGIPLGGRGEADFSIRGDLKDPSVDLDLEVPKVTLGANDMGPLAFRASWARGRTRFSGSGWNGGLSVQGRLEGRPLPSFVDSSFFLTGIRLHALAEGIARSPDARRAPPWLARAAAFLSAHGAGRLSLQGTLQGPANDPDILLRARLSKGKLSYRELKAGIAQGKWLDLEGGGGLELRGGVLRVGDAQGPVTLEFSTPAGSLQASCEGRLPLLARGPDASAQDLTVAVQGSLAPMDALPLFQRPGGRLKALLSLTGPRRNPRISGDVDISGFHARMTKYLDEVRDGSVSLHLQGDSAVLKEFHFWSGGDLDAQGQCQLASGSLASAHLRVWTEGPGVRLAHWDEMARGYVELKPLTLSLEGGGPLRVEGRVFTHDATVFFAGGGAGAKPAPGPASGPAAAQAPAGVRLDLKLGVGDNVWYQNVQDIDLAGLLPSLAQTNLSDLAQSLGAFFLKPIQPSLQILLKPTAGDFSIQGPLSDLCLSGDLGIQRGTFSIWGNDFILGPEGRLSFQGDPNGLPDAKRRGNLTAQGTYTVRPLPSAANPNPTTVQITAKVLPWSEDELVQHQWQDRFLNYRLEFSSEPTLPEPAIISLLTLGVDSSANAQNAGLGGPNPPSQDLSGSTVFFGFLSRYVKGLVGNVFGGVGGWLSHLFSVDSLSASPSVALASQEPAAAADAPGAPVSGSAVNSVLRQVQGVQVDFGKSLTQKLYLNGQYLYTDPGTYQSNNYLDPNASDIHPDGGRLGLEYSLGGAKQLKAYMNWNVDDNLQPLPNTQSPFSWSLYWSGGVGYSAYNWLEASRRREQALAGR